MSVYLKDEEIAFDFTIPAYPDTPPTDVDVVLIGPTSATNSAESHQYEETTTLTNAVYTAPTVSVAGSYTFNWTFTVEGSWKVQLVSGTAADHEVLIEVGIYIYSLNTAYGYTFDLRPGGAFPA